MFKWLLAVYLVRNSLRSGRATSAWRLVRDLEAADGLTNRLRTAIVDGIDEDEGIAELDLMASGWRGRPAFPRQANHPGALFQAIPLRVFRLAYAAMLLAAMPGSRAKVSRLHQVAAKALKGQWYRPFTFQGARRAVHSEMLQATLGSLVDAEILAYSDRERTALEVVDHISAYAARMLMDRVDTAASYWIAYDLGKDNPGFTSALLGTRKPLSRTTGKGVGPAILDSVPEMGVDVRYGLTSEDILEIAARLSMPFEQFEANIVAANAAASTLQ